MQTIDEAREHGIVGKGIEKMEHGRVQLWEGGPFWAETNIGADQPWEVGYYFWWGDTVGYKREHGAWVASGCSSFSFFTHTYGQTIEALKNGRWITANEVLAPKHDAAQVQWGGAWRMPTRQELEDLCDKCDWNWTKVHDINGYIVRGKGGYAANSIFLPCAGYGSGTSLESAVWLGSYWSSAPDSDCSTYAWYLDFSSSGHDTYGEDRDTGMSIRPVQGILEG